MENITIGQIAAGVAFLAALIGGVAVLLKYAKKWMVAALQGEFAAVKKQIGELQNRVDGVDLATSKNYLVDFLSRVDRGDPVDEIELERFWEQYNHYREIGGNSYVKTKVERMKAAGKL
ncbi:MAG: hypothetical protein IKO68_08205 [Oscillospiraceae bacterium]|nr:hypothetical protein [Oscillospiraceae bacterium]